MTANAKDAEKLKDDFPLFPVDPFPFPSVIPVDPFPFPSVIPVDPETELARTSVKTVEKIWITYVVIGIILYLGLLFIGWFFYKKVENLHEKSIVSQGVQNGCLAGCIIGLFVPIVNITSMITFFVTKNRPAMSKSVGIEMVSK